METRNSNPGRTRGQAMMYIFGLFMLVFYLGMAYVFFFSKVLAENMSPTIRYVMGTIFAVYGVFRLYRQIRVKNQDNQ